MKYDQQSTKPNWYENDDSKIYVCATNGTSPFNEWYEFDDRREALELIATTFKAPSFMDQFLWVGKEIYLREDVCPKSIETAENSDDYVILPGADPADLGDIIAAESRF